jgi:dTDP-4-dehydrorhamnose reductase
VSWADFAEEILRVLPVPGRGGVKVSRIPSSAYPTPAQRPAYSVLDATKAARTFGVRLPSWGEQLRMCAASAGAVMGAR